MDRSGDWLRQAERDLQRAKIDIEHEYYEWACFTSQQAIEKVVKAVYQSLNSSVRGHSIVKMLKGLEGQFEIHEDIIHGARILDRYYIEARYPNGFPEGSPFEYFDKKIAEEAYNAAREIFEFCENIISRLRRSD